jgi:hypothetical protein
MADRSRNLKVVKTLKTETSPQLRWLKFAKDNIDKTSAEYISAITGMEELQSTATERQLEAMVREQLKAEFPNVESLKSYEMLVDAVMLNIKKKQIEAME